MRARIASIAAVEAILDSMAGPSARAGCRAERAQSVPTGRTAKED